MKNMKASLYHNKAAVRVKLAKNKSVTIVNLSKIDGDEDGFLIYFRRADVDSSEFESFKKQGAIIIKNKIVESRLRLTKEAVYGLFFGINELIDPLHQYG